MRLGGGNNRYIAGKDAKNIIDFPRLLANSLFQVGLPWTSSETVFPRNPQVGGPLPLKRGAYREAEHRTFRTAILRQQQQIPAVEVDRINEPERRTQEGGQETDFQPCTAAHISEIYIVLIVERVSIVDESGQF
jgi:hypothetical protein